MGQLKDKIAIVTGASRGIGEAIARAFVANGAKVVLASRKIEGLAPVAESLGPNALAIAAHTGREEDCVRLVATTVEKLGKVDVLVNNAATGSRWSARRLLRTTAAPNAASPRAIASPMPRLAPVTRATFPCKSKRLGYVFIG